MTQVWMCASCHSLNEAAAKHCYKCRAPRATGEYVNQTGAAGAPGTRAIAARDPSLLGGILFGLVAATLATAVWYWFDLNLTIGYFRLSWLVGVAIAAGVLIGGRGRTSFPLVLFSVILTAVALVVGEYLIVSYVLASADGHVVTGLPIAAPEDVAAALPGMIRDAPLRPVLWLIALGTAFIIPWRGLVGE
jgi:hypothetical protein